MKHIDPKKERTQVTDAEALQAAVPGSTLSLCIAALQKTRDYAKARRLVQYFTPGNPRYGDATGLEAYIK